MKGEVLVLLAEGFEEIETATIVDVLRRGEVPVTLAGLDGVGPCRGSRGIVFVPDVAFDAAEGPWAWVVLPGGMGGTERLAADGRVRDLLQRQLAGEGHVAAICAAPMVLEGAGLLPDHAYTCHPAVAQRLRTPGRQDVAVVDSPRVVTSQSAATAMAFALHLVARERGAAVRAQVATGLGCPGA